MKAYGKHNLVKVAGIMVLITVLLTWIIPQGYYSNGAISAGDITRVGLFDFFTYGLLGMYYFTVLVTFVFVLGGFYQVLSKIDAYQKLTDKIAKTFKRKEILFVILVSFIIAAITSITNEYIVVLVSVPFFITILRKIGLDKFAGFATTFGAILVGVIGSIYSSKVAGMNIQALGTENGTYIWVRVIIFAIAYIAFTVFNVLHIKKTLKDKNAEAIDEYFEINETTKKAKIWPLVTVLILFTVITITAYLPWANLFKIEWFKEALKSITTFELFGEPIFSYILGNISEFGAWDIFGVQVLMLIAILLIKLIYRIKFDDIIASFGEGLKKVGKLVVLLLLSFLVLEFAVMYPVIPTIVDWIVGLSSKFNIFLTTISGLFASMFTVEYQYTLSLIGSYLTGVFVDFKEQISVVLPATYGLASFFSPASTILLLGLSYLGITYKEWMKYIWKYLLIMLTTIIIIMLIIC